MKGDKHMKNLLVNEWSQLDSIAIDSLYSSQSYQESIQHANLHRLKPKRNICRQLTLPMS